MLILRNNLSYWVLPRVSISPGARKNESTPYLTHNDPFYFFCTHNSEHTCMGDWTRFSAAPLHCISSMLFCKPNNHFAQGPKNDYTHAYSHALSNLSSLQSPFWSLSVFLLRHFLFFTPTQLPLLNWRHFI